MPGTETLINLVEDWPDDLSPKLKQFLEYWQSLRSVDGSPPKRTQIDPKEIVNLLPGILIFERTVSPGGGVRYLYRLVGTGHYDANDLSDLTGKYLDEVYDEAISSHTYQTYDHILASGEPHYWQGPSPLPSEKFSSFERILAPLCDEDGEPNMLVGMWVWHN